MAKSTPSVEWRWIDDAIQDNPDDCDHILVERTHNAAAGLASKLDRIILECGNVDSEDMDRILAVPELERSCSSLAAECEGMRIAIDLAVELMEKGLTINARRVLVEVRGGGEPDA